MFNYFKLLQNNPKTNNQKVNNQKVNNQKVNGQKVNNQNVNNQKVNNQKVNSERINSKRVNGQKIYESNILNKKEKEIKESDNNETNIKNKNSQNIIPYSINENNSDKSHFFIGNVLNDMLQIRNLVHLRKKIRSKYRLIEPHWNNKLYTNFIYLGYFDMNTANIYMSNIITPLLQTLADKIKTLDCHYIKYNMKYDGTFNRLSLEFGDKDNLIENIILPYLFDNAIIPIYNRKSLIPASIDLLYYKSSPILSSIKDFKFELPIGEFKINYLSLIKGTPIKYRPGTPSLHDQLNIEEIYRHRFVFNSDRSDRPYISNIPDIPDRRNR